MKIKKKKYLIAAIAVMSIVLLGIFISRFYREKESELQKETVKVTSVSSQQTPEQHTYLLYAEDENYEKVSTKPTEKSRYIGIYEGPCKEIPLDPFLYSWQPYDNEAYSELIVVTETDAIPISYDSEGRPIYSYDMSGNPIYGYDVNGNPVYGYDALGNPIYGYDADGNAIYQIDSQGRKIIGYDGEGNPIYASSDESYAAGEKGEDGAHGTDGESGNKGEDGTHGTDGESGNKGQDGADGEPGARGQDGTDGEPGAKGVAGKSSYVHIRYSAASDGADMTEQSDDSTRYIGICVSTNQKAPSAASDYTWSMIRKNNDDDVKTITNTLETKIKETTDNYNEQLKQLQESTSVSSNDLRQNIINLETEINNVIARLMAEDIYYDNSTSGAEASNVQGALDELFQNGTDIKANLISSLENNRLGIDETSSWEDIFTLINSKYGNTATVFASFSDKSEASNVQNGIDLLFQNNATAKINLGKAVENSGKTITEDTPWEDIYTDMSELFPPGYDVTYIIDKDVEEIAVCPYEGDAAEYIPQHMKNGYTFLGWRTDTTANSNVLSEKVVSREGLVLYAVFKKVLTASFDGNAADSGSTANVTGTMIYNNGNSSYPTIILPSSGFVLPNNVFNAWRCGSPAGTSYAPGAQYTFSTDEDVVFYVSWSPYLYYNGTFASNYGGAYKAYGSGTTSGMTTTISNASTYHNTVYYAVYFTKPISFAGYSKLEWQGSYYRYGGWGYVGLGLSPNVPSSFSAGNYDSGNPGTSFSKKIQWLSWDRHARNGSEDGTNIKAVFDVSSLQSGNYYLCLYMKDGNNEYDAKCSGKITTTSLRLIE